MPSILLIEDHPGIRENIVEILRLANYEVCTAVNGKEGLERAREKKPHLILCDVNMPVLNVMR